MSSAGPVGNWLFRAARNPAPRLLRQYRKTSSSALAKHCSTSAQRRANPPLRLSIDRLLLSTNSLRCRESCVGEGFFAQTSRPFSASATSLHNDLVPPKPGEELHVTFVDKEGDEHTFEVAKGDNLLDIALENDIEMEGACGGSCACSTCHVIVEDEEMYNKMDEPDDDENDMLDLAFGLTETSRLGCQVKMIPELDGLRVKLPAMTRNLQASDFSKKNERSD